MEAPAKNLIIVTGPESTGKTTIAQSLAKLYSAGFYPEYAREYIQSIGHKYNYTDIENIAKNQYKQFVDFSLKKQLGVFDTYLIITKVWFLWHSKRYPDWIDKALFKTKGALYLLCAPDIEWVPDSVRENGGEARNQLFNLYRQELENYGLEYHIVTGDGNTRINNAIGFVENYLTQK